MSAQQNTYWDILDVSRCSCCNNSSALLETILDIGKTMTSDYQPLDHLPTGHQWSGPDALRQLIAEMFRMEASERPTADVVLYRVKSIVDENGNISISFVCHTMA